MIVERMLLTVRETAEMLALSRSQVYELIHSERLASVKIGRSRRVSLASIRRFVDGQAA
jgi:excisionase family DNA binding protein